MINSDASIAVLGGRGMLGSTLAGVLKKRGLNFKVFDLPEFDITDAGQLEAIAADFEIIINCAAYTNVEKAESESELANKINAEAVEQLGEFAKNAGSFVLHFSTDFVFDGRLDRPYVETDTANPISAYGRSKLAGEELLVKSGCRFCIIRLEWTYGHAGRNFVKKIIELAKTRDALKVIDDQVGSPTATVEIARSVCRLLENGHSLPEGLFHFAAAGYTSRYDMAKFIFDKLGMNIDLSRCKTADFTSAAKRPLNSRFNCAKIAALLDEPIKEWQGPLEKFLEQL